MKQVNDSLLKTFFLLSLMNGNNFFLNFVINRDLYNSEGFF